MMPTFLIKEPEAQCSLQGPAEMMREKECLFISILKREKSTSLLFYLQNTDSFIWSLGQTIRGPPRDRK
jgi:hypothetical protein